MTREQKHFLMKTLPKFILREQGRGFAMSLWGGKHFTPHSLLSADCITREVPACGTVACIGGSTQLLLKLKTDFTDSAAMALGLTHGETEGLFYRWGSMNSVRPRWPKTFAKRYAKARTPLAKARIAAQLCVLVGKTEGRCLHRKQ